MVVLLSPFQCQLLSLSILKAFLLCMAPVCWVDTESVICLTCTWLSGFRGRSKRRQISETRHNRLADWLVSMHAGSFVAAGHEESCPVH